MEKAISQRRSYNQTSDSLNRVHSIRCTPSLIYIFTIYFFTIRQLHCLSHDQYCFIVKRWFARPGEENRLTCVNRLRLVLSFFSLLKLSVIFSDLCSSTQILRVQTFFFCSILFRVFSSYQFCVNNQRVILEEEKKYRLRKRLG